MRGLKPAQNQQKKNWKVASFTDAWIETAYIRSRETEILVASFTDAWIETLKYSRDFIQLPSHLLQMRGLKLFMSVLERMKFCRIFYRCVD